MAYLEKRGKSYLLRWSDANGNEVSEWLGRVGSAVAKAAKKTKELELAGNQTGSMPMQTFQRFVEDHYLPWYLAQYPSSYNRVKGIFENHILRQAWATKPLNAIQVLDFQKFYSSRLTLVATETANKELKQVRALYNRAREWKQFGNPPLDNPTKEIKLRRVKADDGLHFYTPDDLHELYRSLDARIGQKHPLNGQDFSFVAIRNKLMWKLMANCGLRRSEAIRLRRQHVRRGSMLIESTEQDPTKGGRSREVPMNEQAQLAFDLLCDHVKVKVGGYVFPRVNVNSLSRLFSNDAERAGLDGSIHWLRHTFGANMAMAGVPLPVLQELMGHEHIETTMIYASVHPDYIKDSTSRIAL